MAAGTEGSTRIYIGNLTRDIENSEVEAAFGKFGDIASLWVGRNPPGFGFIVSAAQPCSPRRRRPSHAPPLAPMACVVRRTLPDGTPGLRHSPRPAQLGGLAAWRAIDLLPLSGSRAFRCLQTYRTEEMAHAAINEMNGSTLCGRV